MNPKQRATFGVTFTMVTLALSAFLLGAPSPAIADCSNPNSCEFANQCYSHGACPRLDCTSGQGQVCHHGSWLGCDTCLE